MEGVLGIEVSYLIHLVGVKIRCKDLGVKIQVFFA